jgi:hypothetical protein
MEAEREGVVLIKRRWVTHPSIYLEADDADLQMKEMTTRTFFFRSVQLNNEQNLQRQAAAGDYSSASRNSQKKQATNIRTQMTTSEARWSEMNQLLAYRACNQHTKQQICHHLYHRKADDCFRRTVVRAHRKKKNNDDVSGKAQSSERIPTTTVYKDVLSRSRCTQIQIHLPPFERRKST